MILSHFDLDCFEGENTNQKMESKVIIQTVEVLVRLNLQQPKGKRVLHTQLQPNMYLYTNKWPIRFWHGQVSKTVKLKSNSTLYIKTRHSFKIFRENDHDSLFSYLEFKIKIAFICISPTPNLHKKVLESYLMTLVN